MSLGTKLLCSASVLLAITVAVRASEQLPSGPQVPSPKPSAFAEGYGGQASASNEYAGSASCERCHTKERKRAPNSVWVNERS